MLPSAEKAAQIGSQIGNVAMNLGSTFSDSDLQDLPLAQRYLAGAISGAGTAAIGALTDGGAEGLIAKRLFNQEAAPAAERGILPLLKNAIKEGVQEYGEGMSDYAGQQVAKGQPIDFKEGTIQNLPDVVMGALTGGATHIGTNLGRMAQPLQTQQTTPQTDEALIQSVLDAVAQQPPRQPQVQAASVETPAQIEKPVQKQTAPLETPNEQSIQVEPIQQAPVIQEAPQVQETQATPPKNVEQTTPIETKQTATPITQNQEQTAPISNTETNTTQNEQELNRPNQNGTTVEDIQNSIKDNEALKNTNIVQRFEDLPQDVQEDIRKDLESQGVPGRTDLVEGYQSKRTGAAYLIGDNLKPECVIDVARHETIGHYGLHGMMEDIEKGSYAKLMNDISNSIESNKTLQQLRDDVMKSQPNISGTQLAEEIAAKMAERNIHNTFTQRIFGAIRRFLHKVGLIKGNVTDAQLAKYLRDAQKWLANENGIRSAQMNNKAEVDSTNTQTKSSRYNNFSLNEKAKKEDIEQRNRIKEWLSPENLQHTKGMNREQIFKAYDNTPMPIATLHPGYLNYFTGKTKDNHLYSGEAYFIDHAINSHSNIDYYNYNNIQDILDDPYEVIRDTRNGRDNLIFTKLYDRTVLAAVSLEPDENGRIVMHKSLSFNRSDKPYPKLNRVQVLPVDADPRYIHADTAYGGKRLSALDNDSNIVHESIESNTETNKNNKNKQSSETEMQEGRKVEERNKNNQRFDKEREKGDFSLAPHDSERTEGFFVPDITVADNIIRALQDQDVDIKRVQDAILQAGGAIHDESDVYLNKTLYISKVADRLERMNKEFTDPILTLINQSKVSFDEASKWMYARHVFLDHVNEQLAAINEGATSADALSGMSDKDAKNIYKQHTNNKKLQEMAALVDRLMRKNVTTLVNSGLLTSEEAKAWREKYQHYVPLKRDNLGIRSETVLERAKKWWKAKGNAFKVGKKSL